MRLVLLGSGVGGGEKETAPPAMVLSSLMHRQASPSGACLALVILNQVREFTWIISNDVI